MAFSKYKIALVAVLGIGISAALAFTPKSEAPVADEFWFEFVGTNEADSSHYVLTGANPPECPPGDEERCAIKAQPLTAQPTLPDLNTISQEERKGVE